MSNVLMIPASGAIIFDSQSANSSIVSPLSAAPRLSYDNAGGLNITSYTTAASALDRFSVDGASGRLFSVSDSLTGSIFSVNDAAGLPIIEVESNLVDKITMGTYGSNALVINDTKVGMGTALPTAKLDIVDTTLAGSGLLSGSVLKLTQTWNTSSSPTAITLNVTNSASGTASNLMDLQVGGVSKLSVTKGGKVASGFGYTYAQPQFYDSTLGAGAGFQITNTNAVTVYGNGTALMGVDYGSTNGVRLASHIPIGWTNSHAISNPSDLTLFRDTSNTLAQRNGINPQAFRLYNTYTDAVSAFERLNIKWDTDVLKLGTEKGSTGGLGRAVELQTDGTTRMTITSAGRVGIGITNPSLYNLTIQNADTSAFSYSTIGILKHSSSATDGRAALTFSGDFGNSFRISQNGYTTTGDNTPNHAAFLELYNQNGMFIGTGQAPNLYAQFTTAIEKRFSIYSALNSSLTNYERLSFKPQLTGSFLMMSEALGTGAYRNIEIQNGGSTRMTVTSAGNIGIGTTTPTTKLDIITSAAQDGIKLTRADGERAAWLVDDTNGIGALYLFNGGNGNSVYLAGNGNSFINGGNVGIGTGAPANKLHVEGTANGEGLRVSHSAGGGTRLDIITGDGSQVAVGAVGFQVNGVSMLLLNSQGLILGGGLIRANSNTQTINIHGGYSAGTLGNSLVLGSNTINGGPFTATSGTQNTVSIGNASNESWNPASGNAAYNLLRIAPVINTSGTYAGIVRGLYVNPTLTSVTGTDFRALDLSNTSGFGVYQSGASANNYFAGKIGIGTTTPNERLTVVGNISAAGDIAVATSLQGVILVSPDSTRWKITVNDDGSLQTTAL